MADDHFCGVYYTSTAAPFTPTPAPFTSYKRRYLPQARFEVRTRILAPVARTTLTQTFVNNSPVGLREARYTFPRYGGVTVVAFECRVGLDRVIRGRVWDRQAAVRLRDRARDRVLDSSGGETLLDPLPSARDVFSATITNVPPRAKLRVVISYVGELRHDAEIDSLRFTLPANLAPCSHSYPAKL